MELQILAKNNVEVSETIREYANKKMSKLNRYLPTIGEGKMEVSEAKTKLPEQRFTVQVTLDSKGTLIRAQEKAGDLRTAIDMVMGTISTRIERYKGKLYDKGRGISLTRQETIEETGEDEGSQEVVKSKHFLVKPMGEDEAIRQMELLGHDFFLFVNADTGVVNLLYRRKDGKYGLIVPDAG